MSYTLEQLKLQPDVGRPIANTVLTDLMSDFDAPSLVLGVSGNPSYVEVGRRIALNLDRMKEKRVTGITLLGDVPVYQALEQLGVVNINTSTASIGDEWVTDYSVKKGEKYSETEVVGVRRAKLPVLDFLMEPTYFPIRRH